jgi:glycosyltransferase involved in cell wall biosynthesis
MHNILWRSYEHYLDALPAMPAWYRRLRLEQYRRREERAWREFDAVITINREEHDYVSARVAPSAALFYAPMGVDLGAWPHTWKPGGPARVAFYGGLASEQNQRHALVCANEIMPRIWRRLPDAELWIVGSNPPECLLDLASDPRITVTGFVEDPASVLSGMSLALCPWSGRWGFRSRIVELMGVGVPVVTTHDAVAGMDLVDGRDLLLGGSPEEMAAAALGLLGRPDVAARVSANARGTVERVYSDEATYRTLMSDLSGWLAARKPRAG